MTIQASDLSWAKINLSDTSEAQQALEEIESEVRALKRILAEGGWFEDAFTEREMRKELARLEELEEELCDVLFQDMFDLL